MRLTSSYLEGETFVCPWTEKKIQTGVNYDIDHLVPLSVYPTNELWNLLPSDPYFNSHMKRDRLPTSERLQQARPHLTQGYTLYCIRPSLSRALQEDVAVRFTTVNPGSSQLPDELAHAVASLLDQLAESRNIARF
jgi:hypothetical protein